VSAEPRRKRSYVGIELVRQVTFTGADDFFPEPVLANVARTWEQWLGPLVPGLPAFATVIGGLRPLIGALDLV
jgi:hypothetical protein